MLQKPRPAGLLIPLSFNFLRCKAVSKKPVKQVKAAEGSRHLSIPAAGEKSHESGQEDPEEILV